MTQAYRRTIDHGLHTTNEWAHHMRRPYECEHRT